MIEKEYFSSDLRRKRKELRERIVRYVTGPLAERWLDVKIDGLENIPEESFIVAPHHQIGLDGWIIKNEFIKKAKRVIHWWTQFEGVFNSRWRGLLEQFEEIPLSLKNNKSYPEVIKQSTLWLENTNDIIGIFESPSENGIERDEVRRLIRIIPIYDPYRPNFGGAVTLASKSKKPIVPISEWCPHEASIKLWQWGYGGPYRIAQNFGYMEAKKKIPYYIQIGKALHPKQFSNKQELREEVRRSQIEMYIKIAKD